MVQKLTICSKDEVRIAISNLITSAKQECSLSEDREFCIRLTLNELINNAIINHDRQENLIVDVWFKTDPAMHMYKILVSSNGCGFDATAFLKRMEDKPCETMAESGRGLMLVKAHSQSLKFNRKGNKVLVLLS